MRLPVCRRWYRARGRVPVTPSRQRRSAAARQGSPTWPLPRLLGNICDQGNMFSAMQPAVPLSRIADYRGGGVWQARLRGNEWAA